LTTISKIENNKILFPSKQIWVFWKNTSQLTHPITICL
jgi:hypothetical protein